MRGRKFWLVSGLLLAASSADATVTFVSAKASASRSTITYLPLPDGSEVEDTTTTSRDASSSVYVPTLSAYSDAVIRLDTPEKGFMSVDPILMFSDMRSSEGNSSSSSLYTFSIDTVSYLNWSGYMAESSRGGHSVDDNFGLGNGFISFLPSTTAGIQSSTINDDRSSGTFKLSAGTYSLSLSGYSSGFENDLGDRFSSAHGEELAFDIIAAPEPVTWAMMIGGFGLVGAITRLSRRSDGRFTRHVRTLGGAR